ncbi:hypothetical protein [Bacillus sp. FJAT-45037]|uniref:hypothetical protein n=1 Tax=Bacillus sp. FJAT-45037 TaxID=2011007 RepID=UPI000C24FE5C|nr:hypothetical protein [Bacillus sp. FJAT-45037]
MNRQIPSTLGNNQPNNSLPSSNQTTDSQPDNPYNLSLSQRIGLIAGIITTIGDALAVYAVQISINEEIVSNIDNINSQKEQDARFTNLESQMEQLQNQLAVLSEQKKK